ncbi:MAG: Gfo/Idh/MocA family oxidoreductase [Polyangiaceae bacterium]|nr:Gfo/Idh/MocA family oxidoreductase [Polyangiaceae bacterium]
MTRPKKTLLVGAGKMGRNHLRVLTEDKRFTVGAVVDPRAKQLFPEPGSFRVATTLEEVLDEPWDCAVVATPTGSHAECGRALLGRRIPTLMEKPLAESPPVCAELVALSRELGVPLAVGHLERFNPAVRKATEVLRAGWIGTPIHFSFTRVGGYPEGIQPGNNVLLDLAVHDLDILRTMVGPVAVHAAMCHSTWKPGVLDTAEILLSSEAGPSASIHVNWVTPTKIRSLRITGTRGVCFVDYMLQTCHMMGGNLLKRRFRDDLDYASFVEEYRSSDRVEFGIAKQEPLRAQLDELHRLLTGQPSEVCAADDAAAAVTCVAEALRIAEHYTHGPQNTAQSSPPSPPESARKP